MARGEQRQHREKEKSEFDSKLLEIARVTRVAAGGKRFRFRATVVAGNRNGKVGVGVEKGADVAQAIEKATREARKNMSEIQVTDGTISHPTYGKYSAAKVLLRPQRKGKGLVAGGAVRAICEYVGIRDISAKILSRTSNKLNVARATIEALKKLKGHEAGNMKHETKQEIIEIKNEAAKE